jgi:competence protein ComEA
MPTPGERRALMLIASVAALGVAVRGWTEFHPREPGALAGNRRALARQIEAVDSAIAVSSSTRKARARRAEAPRPERAAGGPSVPGGMDAPGAPGAPPSPRTRGKQYAPVPDPPARDPREAYWNRSLHFDSVRIALDGGAAESVDRRAPRGGASPPYALRGPAAASPRPPVDLDVASIDEAGALPLIGPGLAQRIVTDRIDRGPFGSLQGLERIPGITAAFTRRLAPFVTFSLAPRLGGTGESPLRSKSDRRPKRAQRP